MSAISDFAAKVDAYNEKVDAAITGLSADVKFLQDEIIRLQTTPGPISAEDQATLDRLEARAAEAVAKLDALDAMTPPATP